MNKSNEAILAIIVAFLFIAILQGHRLHKEGQLPPVFAKIFSLGTATELKPENPQTAASAQGETANEVPVQRTDLPAFAMVNKAQQLLDITSKEEIGLIKQGTVVDVQEQKGTFFRIYIGGAEGLIPADSLTFRK